MVLLRYFIESIQYINYLCCCRYSKKKRKLLTDEEIEDRAKEMLNDWQVTTYANNKFLHKIPEERRREQYNLFIKEIEENNI